MKKVLVVCDVDWWAFAKIYRGLKKCLAGWQIDPHYTRKSGDIKHDEYDVVLFLCDFQFELIKRNDIPREKLILAIRSNVRHKCYDDPELLKNTARIIAASNEKLKERFERLHDNVVLAPGGVDTDKFSFREWNPHVPLRVGWSGSYKNFGEGFRGVQFIREACEKLKFIFNPAIREHKLRTEDEMVEYYHKEIDIYVDMSAGAGRQNGLLEAGSCGIPVISSRVGIAESLIQDGKNGLFCDRKSEVLQEKLWDIIPIAQELAINMRKNIEEKWSWEAHSKIFEAMFREIVDA